MKLIKMSLIAGFLISVLLFPSSLSFSSSGSDITKSLLFPEYSRRISMDFKNANLKDILKIFSQQSGLNFIASEEVEDKLITLYLDNVPVEDALEQLLGVNNLQYEIEKGTNIFIVKPQLLPKVETITKVYFLKYASVSGAKITSEISKGFTAGGAETKITSIIKGLLSEFGKISEDPRTNSITITDIPNRFPLIEEMIAKLDVAVPQVLIEVEMLDVTKDAIDRLGPRFGQTPFTLTGGKKTTYFPFQDLGRWYPSDPTYTLGTLDFTGLTMALDFLSTRSDTRYLARPRILTLSNETAEIKISAQEAVGTQSTTTGGEAGAAATTSEAERYETGVTMRVTPQVNLETGEITMYIEPRVVEAKEGGTFSGITYKDPETRGTKSVVRVRDSETIVIGGLMRRHKRQTITKVPFLGDIPIMGALFRNKTKSKDEDRELIVFITPRIIKEPLDIKALAATKELEREQESPTNRLNVINNALVDMENKRR